MNLLQRSPSLTLRLSFCAAVLLAVAGCDDNGSDVASNDASTTASASSSPSESPSTSPSSSPSESLTETTSSTPTDSPTDSATDSPTETSQTPTPSDAPKPELIPYAGGESAGVLVHDRADVRKLDGAPAAFKQFIARTAAKLVRESTCDDGAVGVNVATLRTDGFAEGGVNDCGGYAALWAVVDGHWKQIAGTQETWGCGVLKRYAVPSTIAGERCYDYKAQKERRYHQR